MPQVILDGAYYFQESAAEPHCDDEPPPPRPCYILRFFVSGVVASANVMTGDPARDWAHIGSWLGESHPDRGPYRIHGDVISFTITSPSGSVDYFGVVADGSLTLSWRSNINGSIRNGLRYVQFA